MRQFKNVLSMNIQICEKHASYEFLLYYRRLVCEYCEKNKNVDIKFSAHNAFLE